MEDTQQINHQVTVILLRKIIELLSLEDAPVESVDIGNLDEVKAHLRNELRPVVKSIEGIPDNKDVIKQLKIVSDYLKKIEFTPTINVAAANIPDVVVPEIKIPEINVPTPQVTVNVPDVIVPEFNIPTPIVNVEAPIINVPEVNLDEVIYELSVGLKKLKYNNSSNPIFVRMADINKILESLDGVRQASKEVMLGFPGAIRIQNATGGIVDFNSISPLATDDIGKQGLWDYVGGTNAIYAGFAVRGLAQASAGWTLIKFTYDGNNNVTQRQIAYDSWNNRATTAVYA